jgi:putative inorganic carbon (hco3(-)) transporter
MNIFTREKPMNAHRPETTTLQSRFPTIWQSAGLTLLLVGLAIAGGLAAAFQASLIALVMVALVMMLVLLARPDTATPLVVFLLYSNVVVLGVRFHGLPSFVSFLIPMLLLLPLFYHLVIQKEKLILPRSLPWVALFMIVIIISTIISSNFSEAFSQLIVYFTEGIFLYVLFTNVIRNSRQMRYAIWGMLAAGILMGAVPLYQQLTGTFDNNYGGLAQLSEATFRTGEENLQGDIRQPRLAGAIGEINRFAQVMLILVPLGMFRFWGETSRPLRLLALLATVLAGLGMVLAFSRGAAVAFGLMIVVMTIFRVIKPLQLLAFILVAGLLLAALPQYSARILSIQTITGFFNDQVSSEETSPDGAIKGRATVMLAAARVYADHPVFGVGPEFSSSTRASTATILD